VRGRSVHTYKVMSGAMRGFGANQSNFVVESLVDMAARETSLSPVEIRLRNALRPGLPTITGHVLEPWIRAVVDVLDAVRLSPARLFVVKGGRTVSRIHPQRAEIIYPDRKSEVDYCSE
jgi:hypothetical protein